jgi:pilus assembly protein CpaB
VSSRRTLILIVALVIGAIAAVALWSYVDGIEDRAYDNARRVKVFRVEQDIPKGQPGEQAISEEFIKSAEIPEEFRPGTSLTDLNTIRGKVALTDLSAGQVVVDGMFVDPRVAQITFSQRIPAGQVAISVSIDSVRGVAGLLVPGDTVNVIIDDPTAPEATKAHLFQNLNILAIGSTAAPEAGDTSAVTAPGSGLLTFAVPPLAAQQIAFVGGGGMYLTLVPPDNQPIQIPPTTAQNLLSGGLTPYPDEG